ncbi:hypothetical protein ACVWYN_002947 [Pedobacter sp. UYP24]
MKILKALVIIQLISVCAFGQKSASKKTVKLKDAFGVNAFEWDFLDDKNGLVVNEAELKAMKSFSSIRHYMDWEKLEQEEGSYTFNPTRSGGWNYDAFYQSCKAQNIMVLACLKTIPKWMQETYPADMRDAENVPVKYGKEFSDPKSYIEQAKVAFQYAARYGSNNKVELSLLKVNGNPRWGGDQVNVVKRGMDLIKYIECDNERDKWWKGPKAYSSGKNFAANMSAFYDGHKNTMGPGVGVKNADPGMIVVMGGLAKPNIAYVKEMIDWCRENRGLKKDGSVNLCWDVINYHYYTGDDSSPTGGEGDRGKSPEASSAERLAREFVGLSKSYAGNMPVWLSETGYDVNAGSPLKALPVGNKSALLTQADWILRTSLLNIRNGISRVFFYQAYDFNLANPGKFSSSGLLNANRTRKPAADYLFQASKLIGNYTFYATAGKDVIVDEYLMGEKKAFILTKPTEDGTKVSITLALTGVKSVKICKPSPGSDQMSEELVNVKNGKLNIFVTETPTFILPVK